MIYRVVRSLPLRSLRRRVDDTLRRFRGRRVLYFSTPGNAGDSLIGRGTLDSADRVDLQLTRVGPGDDVAGATVLVGGGGNLVPSYHHAAAAIESFLDGGAARIVVLPHTIRGHADVLARLRRDDLVICRDLASLQYVRSVGTQARIDVAHDMAFGLDIRRMLGDPELAARARPVFEQRLGAAGFDAAAPGVEFPTWIGRTDVERHPDAPTAALELDLSRLFIIGDTEEDLAVSAWCLAEAVRRMSEVQTDRLHVAIAGVLLGKRVELRPNNYDKNREVFAFSLSSMPGVSFGSHRGLDRSAT